MDLLRAAGGLVWRQGAAGPRLALVHRPVQSDWSLPKGRLDDGESWRSAALREVSEETGCEVRITAFAGAKLYLDRDLPKLVLYWHMQLVRDGQLDDDEEVDEVAWLSPSAALSRFDHGSDRRLLLRALAARRSRGARTGQEALRSVLVLDRQRPDEELGPYLRLIARSVDGAGRRSEGRVVAVRRRLAARS
jgi:8-oxo-dGTP pyrophosphatase MutT (NUDIX family)